MLNIIHTFQIGIVVFCGLFGKKHFQWKTLNPEDYDLDSFYTQEDVFVDDVVKDIIQRNNISGFVKTQLVYSKFEIGFRAKVGLHQLGLKPISEKVFPMLFIELQRQQEQFFAVVEDVSSEGRNRIIFFDPEHKKIVNLTDSDSELLGGGHIALAIQ